MRGFADSNPSPASQLHCSAPSPARGEGDARSFDCYQRAMTAAEGTRRLGFGERFARAAAVFLDPRVLIILLLGFSSGLPSHCRPRLRCCG